MSKGRPVSVVIIVRNEALCIDKCIRAVLANKYDNIESIIVVDDHSSDGTLDMLRSIDSNLLTVLELKNFKLLKDYDFKFKKAGLNYALQHVDSDWVLTTDGDCVVGENWIKSVMHQIETQKLDLATGFINIIGEKSLIDRFQNIEMKGTMAATKVGIESKTFYSANAANMVFRKVDYLSFLKDHDESYASGDDIFFAQWASIKQLRLGFIDHIDAVVRTSSLDNFSDLYNQRLRWATKTKSYKTLGLKLLMSGLFLFHLTAIILPIAGFLIYPDYVLLTFVPLIVKCLVDYLLITAVSKSLQESISILNFPILVVFHILYLVVMGAAGLLFNRYNWKGRQVT